MHLRCQVRPSDTFHGMLCYAAVVCHRDASLETELERLCAEYCTRLGVESVNGQCQPLGRSLQFQLGQSSSSQRQDLPVDSPVLEFARSVTLTVDHI